MLRAALAVAMLVMLGAAGLGYSALTASLAGLVTGAAVILLDQFITRALEGDDDA
jgi:ABC-type cobalamin transport system ATPase subunit